MTPPVLLDLVIASRLDDRGGIMRLDLVAADGADLPPFEAGAHVTVHVDDIATGLGLERPYSLWGDPADRKHYRLGILLEPESRGGSRSLHRSAKPGRRLRVAAPRNLFPLVRGAGRPVLIGGGIGVTPVLAMARTLAGEGADFLLHYCTRSAERTAFLDVLADPSLADRVVLHHDDGAAAGPLVPARDLPAVAEGAHLHVCGPAGFMDWVIGAARDLGYPDDRIHREYFGAEVDLSGGAFEVEARRSGVTVTVAAGETIVAALEAVGVSIAVSCGEGVCGTCLCDVLEGVPDHRDQFLTDDEKAAGDQILPCCSRARSDRLVLDV